MRCSSGSSAGGSGRRRKRPAAPPRRRPVRSVGTSSGGRAARTATRVSGSRKTRSPARAGQTIAEAHRRTTIARATVVDPAPLDGPGSPGPIRGRRGRHRRASGPIARGGPNLIRHAATGPGGPNLPAAPPRGRGGPSRPAIAPTNPGGPSRPTRVSGVRGRRSHPPAPPAVGPLGAGSARGSRNRRGPSSDPGLRNPRAAIGPGDPSRPAIVATSRGGPSRRDRATGRGNTSRQATGGTNRGGPSPTGIVAGDRGGPSPTDQAAPSPGVRSRTVDLRRAPRGKKTIRGRPTTAHRGKSVVAKAARGW